MRTTSGLGTPAKRLHSADAQVDDDALVERVKSEGPSEPLVDHVAGQDDDIDLAAWECLRQKLNVDGTPRSDEHRGAEIAVRHEHSNPVATRDRVEGHVPDVRGVIPPIAVHVGNGGSRDPGAVPQVRLRIASRSSSARA